MFLKPSAYLETIIAFLLPYFVGAASDLQDARAEIIDTLASYTTRTRAELLQAAQIIAFGMTTLDVLAEAKTVEMSVSLRIRHRSCANGLSRSGLNTEKSLQRRLACDPPDRPGQAPEPLHNAHLPNTPAPNTPAPNTHRPNADQYVRDRQPDRRPAPEAPEVRNKEIWAGAMIDALRQMGYPAG